MRTFLLCLLLMGCTTTVEVPRVVEVPVPVPCIDQIPKEPEALHPEVIRAIPDEYRATIEMYLGYLALWDYKELVKILLEVCKE